MPSVQISGIDVAVGAPDTAFTKYVDLAVLLSQKYGKTIRQGQNFQISGIQARLRAVGSGYDTGLSVNGSMGYCPTTSHTRRAWNEAYQMWRKQKQLSNTVGSSVRYDDFEFSLNEAHKALNPRTSTLAQSGMLDADPDHCVLYGNSSESSNVFSLSDYYISQHPIQTASKFSYNGSVIKSPKFQSFFPETQYAYFSTNLSSMVAEIGDPLDLIDSDALGSSLASTDVHEFPEHINALAGLLKFTMYVHPDDTLVQYEDAAKLDIIIFIKKWSPLVRSTKSRKSRKPRSSRRKSYRPRRKWSRSKRRRFR